MPPSKHAVLSASSSHRWLNCNPSARLESEFEDRETEAAAEGTAAHALAEHMFEMQELDTINEFDEKLWLTIIDVVTVYADGRMTFRFQGGTEIDV